MFFSTELRNRNSLKVTVAYAIVGWLLALSPVLITSEAHGQEGPLRGLDQYIQKSMTDWQVPGLAIVVVKDDQIVFMKGYGVREVGKDARVDEQTIFSLASATKPFTVATVAMLVDEGKLSWDDPVIKHLPWLQLRDPWVTREVNLRDLLAHRLGDELGPNEWVFEVYACGVTKDEILRRLRYLDPGPRHFRERAAYTDLNYLLAGEVVAAVSGMSWPEFLQSRLLQPLGMTSATTNDLDLWDVKDLRPCPSSDLPHHTVGIEQALVANIVMPHEPTDDGPRPTPWSTDARVDAAGSIMANVEDVAKWLRLQLGQGVFEGKRFMSAAVVNEMHMGQRLSRSPSLLPDLPESAGFWTYGLGWFLTDYRGRKLVMHWGASSAFTALVPEENLGVAVLTNLDPRLNRLPSALVLRILDIYLGGSERDWSSELVTSVEAAGDPWKMWEQMMARTRVLGTEPSVPLGSYVGTYTHPAFGEVTVTEDSEALVLHFPPYSTGDLAHWHYDVFQVNWRGRHVLPSSLLTFLRDLAGEVDDVSMGEVGVFTRIRQVSNTDGEQR